MLALLGVAAAEQVDWGFSQGLAPLPLRGAPTAAECGSCHEEEHAEWSSSRHRQAHTSPLYQAGLVAEPAAFCVNCHSPRPDQAAEVLPELAAFAARDPSRHLPALASRPTPRAEDGVDCAACHWRDGEVLGTDDLSWGPHRVRADSALTDGTLCMGCHEFSMPVFTDGAVQLTDTPMQSTWTEWAAWRDAGGQASCTDCHFPGGDHSVVHGAHDRDGLRDAIALDATWNAGEATFTLKSVGTGHALPTGDLFRHLTLEVDQDGFTPIAWWGRRFETTFDALGTPHKREVEDHRLQPDTPERVTALLPVGTRWRLVWHDGNADDEARGLVPLEDQRVTLHEGRLQAR